MNDICSITKKRHALITGGAGFIGSHLVDRLLDEGWWVTVVDNFNSFYDMAIKEKNVASHITHTGYHLIKSDIRDLDQLKRLLPDRKIDAIVHLAAMAGVRPSINDPILYQDVNIRGTQNLLELARDLNVKQFIFASSSSVYGINPNSPWREDDLVLLPISPYAATKVGGELLGHVYSHLYGIRFIALRFFTVYGPRQRPDLAIHKFTQLMIKNKRIPVYGDGTSRRDYTFIDDIVKGIREAMDYTASPYEIVNLGNNRTVTLMELISCLEKITGTKANIEYFPNQPGDVPYTYADINKAKHLFGYTPDTDFETGIMEFVRWVKNPNFK